MKHITQLEQHIQQRIEKSKGLNLVRILESRLNKINNSEEGNARIVKALAAARMVALYLSKYYGENR